MGRDKPEGKGSIGSRLAAWLKSFSGILSSFAALVTAVATLIAAYQTTRVHAQSRIIAQQTQQLQQIQSSPVPTVTVTEPAGGGSPGGSTGGATLNQKGYLSALQPTVSYGEPNPGPETMSSRSYPNSITFSCDGAIDSDRPDVAYDIAGNNVFTAVVGIPDSTPNVTSIAETVVFANQNGVQLIKPVVVSLGSPANVRLNVTNVTQLEVTCTGIDVHTHQPDNDNPVTLGNAGVS